MGHFSYDLQPQLISSSAPRLPASWLARFSAMGSFIMENSLLETEQTLNASLAFPGADLTFTPFLVLQCSLHLECPLLFFQKAFPYSPTESSHCPHASQSAGIQFRWARGSMDGKGRRWGRGTCLTSGIRGLLTGLWERIPNSFL